MNIKRIIGIVVAAAVVSVGLAAPAPASAASHTYTVHWTGKAFVEPSHLKGAKGGVSFAYAMCTDENGTDRDGSRLWYTVEDRNQVAHYWESPTWRLPVYEPIWHRVYAGDYQIITYVQCPDGQVFQHREAEVHVPTLEPSKVVSKKEYRSLKNGMSKKSVFKRTGKMQREGRSYGKLSTTFLGWVWVDFDKHGKLKAKHWEIYPY